MATIRSGQTAIDTTADRRRNGWELSEGPARFVGARGRSRTGDSTRYMKAPTNYPERTTQVTRASPSSSFRYADFIEGAPGRRGKKAVKSPSSRRKGHTRYTVVMLVRSASFPRAAAPSPPRPNEKP